MRGQGEELYAEVVSEWKTYLPQALDAYERWKATRYPVQEADSWWITEITWTLPGHPVVKALASYLNVSSEKLLERLRQEAGHNGSRYQRAFEDLVTIFPVIHECADCGYQQPLRRLKSKNCPRCGGRLVPSRVRVELSTRVCPHCEFSWTPRVENPRACPRCKRYMQ